MKEFTVERVEVSVGKILVEDYEDADRAIAIASKVPDHPQWHTQSVSDTVREVL